MAIDNAKIQSVLLTPHLMMVVPETTLQEFGIQLWPGTVVLFQRSAIHGVQTGHFVATDILSDNSIRPYLPVLAKGALLPTTTHRPYFEEMGFYPATPAHASPSHVLATSAQTDK